MPRVHLLRSHVIVSRLNAAAYQVVASDYDGTAATDGRMETATIQALRDLRSSGRRALLVTGRRLQDLERVCPCLDVFEMVVAENGGVLYQPSSGARSALADPPSSILVDCLRQREVVPLEVGHVVIATVRAHENAVAQAVRELRLDVHIVLNRDAVMILPRGVDKATGMIAALGRLGVAPHSVVAVGDAENDGELLEAAGLGVAVANAVPSLKRRANFVTKGAAGAGVVEICQWLEQEEVPA